VLNNSSEAPDPLTFLTLDFGDPYFPPLNSNFTASNCFETCESAVSQLDADLCAARDAFICQHTDPTTGKTTPLFYSSAATGTVFCPDGNPFTYSVGAGLFVALTQRQADLEAGQLAIRLARINMVCLRSIQNYACLKQPYSSGIMATGRDTIPNFPDVNTWELISGSLPPGLTLHTESTGNTCAIDGTPTTAGSYTFQVRFTNPLGSFMTKTFTICATDITASPSETSAGVLPAAILFAPYKETLSLAACVGSVPWSVTAGTLPSGLTLDPVTGVLSGTPGAIGSSTFTVSAGHCAKQFTLKVSLVPSAYFTMDEAVSGNRTDSILGLKIGNLGLATPAIAGIINDGAKLAGSGGTTQLFGDLFFASGGTAWSGLPYAASVGYSVSLWIKYHGTSLGNNPFEADITEQNAGGNIHGGFSIHGDPNGVNPQIIVDTFIPPFGFVGGTIDCGVVPLDLWQHVVCVYDQVAGKTSVYLNGVLKGTVNIGTPWTTATNGGVNLENGNGYFDAYVDELGIWSNLALNQLQVDYLYNESAGQRPPFS